MTTVFPQCLVCTHFHSGGSYTCDAFPAGIPEPILLNDQDHRKPIEDDNDIQWAPREAGDVHPLVILPA